MFAQHTFIEETHKPVMESVIRQNNFVTEKLLAKLYGVAHDLYRATEPIEVTNDVSTSKIVSDKAIVTSATDMQSGIYVQLAGDGKPTATNRQLTVGQKWAMQGKHPTLAQVATKLW
jgi:hypothetical protein